MGKLPFFNRTKAAEAPKPAVMRSLKISFDQPQIEVNGFVFDLLKSDADIFEDAMRIAEQYKDIDVTNKDAVYAALKTMVGYVDTVLGDGAMKKISGGKPVSIAKAQECMIRIASAARDSYASAISEKYDD